MILPAVKDAEYRNLLGARVDRAGNYRALAVVGDAQSGAKIVAAGAAFRKDVSEKQKSTIASVKRAAISADAAAVMYSSMA